MAKYEGVRVVRVERTEVEGEDGPILGYRDITRDGEPWFLVRAQDVFSVQALRDYAGHLRTTAGAIHSGPPREGREAEDDPRWDAAAARMLAGAEEVDRLAWAFEAWQEEHGCKIPD